MSQPSPLATPQPWNLVAGAYTAEVMPMFSPYAADALRAVAPPDGARIVDVACGPGTLAVIAARAGYLVDAIDFAPSMIDQLTAKVAELGHSALRIKARQGDGQALPYDDATFAAGFSLFGLMFFPDRARGFAELRRVIAHGGRAAITSWLPLDAAPFLAAMFASVRETLARTGAPAPAAGTQQLPLVTQEACREEMSREFRDVEVYKITHTQRYASAAELWGSLERTMAPVAFMRHGLGEERWKPVADAAQLALLREVGSGPIEVAMPAWLTVGRAL